MRENLKTLLFGLAVGAALTGPAAAEEQLVMPFACRVAGGQVQLAPSAPQAYQIYGRAQHKRLKTCSPFDPRKCHTWSVHRFDLDCGGARTSWRSVVATLTPMLAESVGTPPNAAGYDERAYAPPGQANRRGPGRPVAFPPGFAPNPMKVASFRQTTPAPAEIALPAKKPVLNEPPRVAEIAPSPKPVAAPPTTDAQAEAVTKTSPVAQKTTALAELPALEIEVDSGSVEVTGSLPKSGAASGTLWQNAAMVFALTLAALLALSATLLVRRRRLLPMPVPRAQLHAPAARTSLARTSHAGPGHVGPHHAGPERPAAAPSEAPATRLRLWDEDWLPATVSEALDVLGVDPDASRDMIKTTVTRLRRALHPDYALDEEDRALRERRLKQINVAWEIISGKRRAPWLKVKPRAS